MRIPIMNLDSLGIIRDVLPHDLPINAWSDGLNVTLQDRRIEKAGGNVVAFTPETPAASFLLPVTAPTGYFWLYAGEAGVFNYIDGVHTQLNTLGGEGQKWTGGVLNGVPFINHPTQIPQQWLPPTQATLTSNLDNWPSTWRTSSLRPFKNYLVSLATKKGVDENPYRVNWSHPADPGQVPSSWDIADETLDCGEVTLADTDGTLVDQLPLRGTNIIYKTDSAYVMQHIGGIDIFRFQPILDAGFGLLVPNGVKKFTSRGEWHIVFGPHDIFTHDGNSSNSIMRSRMRDWLYNNLSSDFYERSFIAHNQERKEMWVCFPQSGSEWPNLALVWNYIDDTTTIRELPDIAFMETGKVTNIQGSVTLDTWANATGTWGTENTPWGYDPYGGVGTKLLSVSHGTPAYADVFNLSTTNRGANLRSYVERIGLNVLGKDMQGRPIFDSDSMKIVTEVWPRFRGVAGCQIDVYVGTQQTLIDPITWHGPYPFIIGTDEKVNPYCSGKIISIRFEHTGPEHWDLAGYDLDVASGGKY